MHYSNNDTNDYLYSSIMVKACFLAGPGGGFADLPGLQLRR